MRNLFLRLSRASQAAWRFSGLLALGLLAVACQTDPEKPQGAQTYQADLPQIPDSLAPQRAVLHVGKDSAVAEISAANTSVKISLQDPPKDTVVVSLWRAGVKIYDLDYVYVATEKLQYIPSTKRPDFVAIGILKRIYPSTDPAAFVKEFAKLLVDNDTLVRRLGFPAKIVVGIDTGVVMREAMKYLVEKGLPLSSVAPKSGSWALGLDTALVRVRLQSMMKDTSFKADTTKLFPPYPVRVKGAIALAAQLVSGGAAVGVTGSFEATYKIVNLSSKVVRDGQDLTKAFEITPIAFTEYPKALDLAGKIEIRAKEGTAAGAYTLEITVQDDSLRKATASVAFQVLPAADKIGPEIRFVQPFGDTAMPNSVATLDVKVAVTDPSGVDSVWIDGKPAKMGDSLWVVTGIAIPVADLGYSVVVRARDALKNYNNANILAVRKAAVDPGQPTLTVLQPKQGEEFDFDSSSILVRWKVEDPRAEVTKVLIGGTTATLDGANVWSRRVDLPSTGAPTTIALMAINARKDTATSFVQATRKLDAKGPVIEILSPPNGAGFSYEVTSASVFAKVTDPSGVDSVRINGFRIDAATGGDYLRTLELVAGKTTEIVVEAWDKLSNKQAATIKVSRKGPPDSTAPKIALLAPKASGELVPLATQTYTLKWLVSDVFGIADTGVRIDGSLATRTKDTFSLVVPVPGQGKEQSYRIDVVNLKGVTNFETVALKRAADVDAPTVVRVDSGKSVAFEIEKATVSWKVADNYKLGTVIINDKVNAGADGVYSAEITLAFGNNPVRLVAKDEAGNIKTDSVVVVRVWKDTSKPVIAREAGTETRNVGFDVATVSLGWKVSDNAKVSVVINGAAVEPNASGVYAYTLTLAGTVNGVKVTATDSSGNVQSDSVTISKTTDAVLPLLVRQTGTKDTVVAYATMVYSVAWKATDNGALATVEIDGKVATKVGDIYSLDVAGLAVGKKVVRIKAVDASSNIAWDSITVQRGFHDSIAPAVVRADTATATKTVQYARDTATVSWKVTDDALKTVTINGAVVTPVGGIYFKKLTLAVGDNIVTLAALDTANNFKGDTLKITRATKDSISPTVVRGAGTGPVSVTFETSTASVSWTVTDNAKLGAVKINDTVTVGAVSVYTRTLALVVGNNLVKLVAFDSAGNSTIDTFTIIRIYKDTVKPVVTRGTGASDRSVAYAVSTTSVSWTVTDNKKLTSVTINGAAVSGSAGVYTATALLSVGVNPVKIVAKDSTGNVTVDSITLIRNASAPSHSLVSGHYVGSMLDTLSSAGAEYLEYSFDGVSWQRYSAPISLSTTGTVYARSQPGNLLAAINIGISKVTSVTSGNDIMFFFVGDTLWAAGKNTCDRASCLSGAIGDGTELNRATPVKVMNGALKVSSSETHTLILKTDGTLWASGSNAFGQIGDGTTNTALFTKQIMANVKDMSAATGYSVVLKLDGTLWSFGDGRGGSLGDSVEYRMFPKQVDTGVDWMQSSAYSSRRTFYHKRSDKSLWVFGGMRSDDGIAVDGNQYETVYHPTFALDSVESMASNYQSAIVKRMDGLYWEAGTNYAGELGFADQNQRIKFEPNYLMNATQIICAKGVNANFIFRGATLYAVGNNTSGMIGLGDAFSISSATPVQNGSNVASVKARYGRSVFMKKDGGLWGMGALYFGGDNPTTTPIQLAVDVADYDVTDGSVTFVKKDGSVWSFGMNNNGALGVGGVMGVTVYNITRVQF